MNHPRLAVDNTRQVSKPVMLNGEKLGHAWAWSEAEVILGMHGYRRRDPLALGTETPGAFEVDADKVERVR